MNQEQHLLERPLSFSEAAEYCSLSKSYLYKLTRLNKISFSKPNGKKIYFLKSDLNNYLLRSKKYINIITLNKTKGKKQYGTRK